VFTKGRIWVALKTFGNRWFTTMLMEFCIVSSGISVFANIKSNYIARTI